MNREKELGVFIKGNTQYLVVSERLDTLHPLTYNRADINLGVEAEREVFGWALPK